MNLVKEFPNLPDVLFVDKIDGKLVIVGTAKGNDEWRDKVLKYPGCAPYKMWDD